jgi:hypothetical protein
VSRHYERHVGVARSAVAQSEAGDRLHDDAWANAAAALRHAEVQSVQPNVADLDPSQLENLTMNDLWALADSLDLPNRDAIAERQQLIAAIRERLYVR